VVLDTQDSAPGDCPWAGKKLGSWLFYSPADLTKPGTGAAVPGVVVTHSLRGADHVRSPEGITQAAISRTLGGGRGSHGPARGAPGRPAPPGRVPRVARLLALAIRLEQWRADGVVKDYAELARLGHVSRARVSQVMAPAADG